MLVNNYFLIQNYFGVTGLVSSASPHTLSIPGTKDFNGAQNAFTIVFSDSNKNCQPRAGLSIVLGTGDTPPDLSDFGLANDVTSSLNISCAVNTGAENGALKTVLTVSGTNSTGSEITIKEFGIAKDYYCGSSGTSSTYKKHLIARELLNEPKVVGAGEPFTLTFEWSGS